MLLPSLDSLVVTISPRLNGAPEQRVGTIPLQLMGRGSGFGIDTLDSLCFAYRVAWPLELIADQVAIKKNNQELLEGVQRCIEQINKTNKGDISPEEMKERQEKAMQDPDIQHILPDPVMRQILMNFQENPKATKDL